ncbi:MAG: hypothetical protein Q7S60_04890 [bacterium]|nr:hypothetical protein [bacterium]
MSAERTEGRPVFKIGDYHANLGFKDRDNCGDGEFISRVFARMKDLSETLYYRIEANSRDKSIFYKLGAALAYRAISAHIIHVGDPDILNLTEEDLKKDTAVLGEDSWDERFLNKLSPYSRTLVQKLIDIAPLSSGRTAYEELWQGAWDASVPIILKAEGAERSRLEEIDREKEETDRIVSRLLDFLPRTS